MLLSNLSLCEKNALELISLPALKPSLETINKYKNVEETRKKTLETVFNSNSAIEQLVHILCSPKIFNPHAECAHLASVFANISKV